MGVCGSSGVLERAPPSEYTHHKLENEDEAGQGKLDFNGEYRLKGTTGGALFYAVAKFADRESFVKESNVNLMLNLLFAFLLNTIALGLVLGLTFLVYAYPIEEREDPWEVDLGTELAALRSAISADPPRELSVDDVIEKRALDLCLQDHTIRFTQAMLIFMWAVKMFPGIVDNFWAVCAMLSLPTANADRPGCYLEKDSGSLVITHLPRGYGMATILLCQLPEVIIDIIILCVGAKFLYFCNCLSGLILKSMAFFFLTQIDEITHTGLTSSDFQKQIKQSSLRWRNESKHLVSRDQWDAWLSTAIRLSVSIGVVVYYTQFFQADVGNFRQECFKYKALFDRCAPGVPRCGMHAFGVYFFQV